MKIAVYVSWCLILVTVLVSAYLSTTKTSPPLSTIYCIMVTGKDNCRYALALNSINNFKNQTYPNKKLIIVNHGLPLLSGKTNGSIEIMVDKQNNTLGDMRNMALELVPLDALWITWDDDDYRAPDLLQKLKAHMDKSHAGIVSISSRIEYNLNTRLIWKMTIPQGMVIFLAKKDGRIRYNPVDTMEDTGIIHGYKSAGYSHQVIKNDPLDYIRLVHGNNTSLYVDPHKAATNANTGVSSSSSSSGYIEEDAAPAEENAALIIISYYYKDKDLEGCSTRTR